MRRNGKMTGIGLGGVAGDVKSGWREEGTRPRGPVMSSSQDLVVDFVKTVTYLFTYLPTCLCVVHTFVSMVAYFPCRWDGSVVECCFRPASTCQVGDGAGNESAAGSDYKKTTHLSHSSNNSEYSTRSATIQPTFRRGRLLIQIQNQAGRSHTPTSTFPPTRSPQSSAPVGQVEVCDFASTIASGQGGQELPSVGQSGALSCLSCREPFCRCT